MILKKNNFGLALGGGGARGFFHIGVLKALQELNLEPKEISGTSIGAVIGVMYSINPKINFGKVVEELDFLEMMKKMMLGIKNGSEGMLQQYLKRYTKVTNFSKLKIKMRFNATDINNNKEVIFEKGGIFPGLAASISIPGVFTPVFCNGEFLVDGGVINNIPVNLIKKSNKILISDITGPIKKIDGKTLRTDVLYSSMALMQENKSLSEIRNIKDKKIIYIKLDDRKTFILDFRKKNYEYLIDLGYEAVMKLRKSYK